LPTDLTNFGASFKKARESRGISLDQIAKQTRISTRFLKAIENEEFQVLPGGIFNRGFVRSFAQAVGLDPDQMLTEYDRLVAPRQPAEDQAAVNARPPRAERHLYPVAAGILAIAVVIFYIAARESNKGTEVTVTPAAPAVTQPTSTPSPSQSEPPPAPEPEQTPVAAPPVTAPASQGLTLDIQAREKTWIKVSADGNSAKPQDGEILEPGMTRKFTAENSLSISIGNAAGLTLKINDMPVKPLGKAGQVRSVKITQENLKDFIG